MSPLARTDAPKVLYVNPTNDASPLLIELVRCLHKRGARFVACTLDGGRGEVVDQLTPYGVVVHHLGASGTRDAPAAVLRLRRLVSDVRPDVLHTNMFLPGVVGEVARRSPGARVPSVFTRHHDVSHHVEGRRAHVLLDAWTARSATVVVAPSDAVRRTLVDRERVDGGKVAVVPHGLRLAGLRPDPRRVAEWRRRFEPGPVLVSASRVDPLKGFDTMLAALALVVAEQPGAVLAVAGAAVAGYDEVVMAAAAARGLADRVHLLGHVSDVHALMAAADVYVSASEAESFGLSVLEAAALGVPLAVTTPGGVSDVVAPDYPPLGAGDAVGLARAVLARLSDPDGSRAIADRAARRVVATFSPEAMAEGYQRAYARALARRGAAA